MVVGDHHPDRLRRRGEFEVLGHCLLPPNGSGRCAVTETPTPEPGSPSRTSHQPPNSAARLPIDARPTPRRPSPAPPTPLSTMDNRRPASTLTRIVAVLALACLTTFVSASLAIQNAAIWLARSASTAAGST